MISTLLKCSLNGKDYLIAFINTGNMSVNEIDDCRKALDKLFDKDIIIFQEGTTLVGFDNIRYFGKNKTKA